jgi:hypothetical protein
LLKKEPIPIVRSIEIIKTLKNQRFSLFIRVLSTFFDCFVNHILTKNGLIFDKNKTKNKTKKRVHQI